MDHLERTKQHFRRSVIFTFRCVFILVPNAHIKWLLPIPRSRRKNIIMTQWIIINTTEWTSNVPVTRIKFFFIFPSGILGIFYPSVSRHFSKWKPFRSCCCIDICYSQLFSNIFIAFMVCHSVLCDRYEETQFCLLHSYRDIITDVTGMCCGKNTD